MTVNCFLCWSEKRGQEEMVRLHEIATHVKKTFCTICGTYETKNSRIMSILGPIREASLKFSHNSQSLDKLKNHFARCVMLSHNDFQSLFLKEENSYGTSIKISIQSVCQILTIKNCYFWFKQPENSCKSFKISYKYINLRVQFEIMQHVPTYKNE